MVPKIYRDLSALVSHGREPNVETDKLFTVAFLLARGKNAKMLGP